MLSKRPRVFFSFRSPFSWMALERLQQAMPDAHDVLEWLPYWEPDAETRSALDGRGAELHYVTMSKAKHLYILQDTKRLVAALGLTMAWPVDVAPWWEPSHLGWLKARRLGHARELYRAVVAARWERGENISDPAVIGAAAAAAGLDPAAIVSAVDDPDIREEGAACLAQAFDDDIFGVPYFRAGHERFWGLDRLDAFLQALGVTAPPAPVVPRERTDGDPLRGIEDSLRERVGAYDTDSAGGCG